MTVSEAKARLADTGAELEAEVRRSVRWIVMGASAAGLLLGRSGVRKSTRTLASLPGLVGTATALIPVVQSVLPIITELIATKRRPPAPDPSPLGGEDRLDAQHQVR